MPNYIRPTAKEAIIEAAFHVFRRDPSASLSEISTRAGVGRATLHRYFPGRDDLIRTLTLIALEEMDHAAEEACENAASYTEALKKMMSALIPLGDRHGFLAQEPLQNDPEISKMLARQRQEMRDIIEQTREESLFDENVPTEWVLQVFDHLLYAAWESVKSEEITHKQAADLAWRTLTIGLIRRKR